MRLLLGLSVFCSIACKSTLPQVISQPVERSSTSESTLLVNAILDEALEAAFIANPISASMRGHREYDRQVPDLSDRARESYYLSLENRVTRARSLLSERSDLEERERLDLELLIVKGEDALRLRKFNREEQRLTQLNGLQTWLMQLPNRLPIAGAEQRADYLIRLGRLGEMVEQEVALLARGMSRGNTPPRAVLEGVGEQVRAILTPSHLESPLTHPLLKPFAVEGLSKQEVEEASEIFLRSLAPSLKSYQDFVLKEYLPGARESVAAYDLPNGEAFYSALIQHYTTTNQSPDEIHALGLREVQRIRAKMDHVIKRTPWYSGNHNAGREFKSFLNHLRTDPRFYYRSAEEMMRDYAVIAKEVDLYLPSLFYRLPRLSFGFEEMDSAVAERAPTAYYYSGSSQNGKPGRFIVNTSKLDERPKYEMRALALHEAEPGHHLQIALAQELASQGLHPWRETLSFTVFVEGWALYAEQLGYEMGAKACGLYCDPYDQFGQLSYEMWRALRLVVDTGLHAKGWSREKAVEFMLANSSMSSHNAQAEVDRYVAWPGQALAYKVGELTINRLRGEASAALGSRFDLRAFHDEVLSRGALPLSLLESYLKQWVTTQETKVSRSSD
ncbi:MAG: DUF885 domain-containing protein [Myxococcota bacterium]|nr:DUF885 domain-containing protein [Myxococcota bacterium]